jgi:hypothetical protein
MLERSDVVRLKVSHPNGFWAVEWVGFDRSRHKHKDYYAGKDFPDPNHPLDFRITYGTKRNDFLGDGFMPIVSQRVVDLFTQEKFTGWRTYPVRVFDKKGAPLVGESFFGLTVHGRGGHMTVVRE